MQAAAMLAMNLFNYSGSVGTDTYIVAIHYAGMWHRQFASAIIIEYRV